MSEYKTFGQTLDDYIDLIEGPERVEMAVIYFDRSGHANIAVTLSEQDYDYTDVFTKNINLSEEIEDKKKELTALQGRIKSLKREKTSIENAIKKLAKYNTSE